MSKLNYSTQRNKPTIEWTVVNTYKLNAGYVKQLSLKLYKFNAWELSFYNSLRSNQFKIVSGKQWNIIKKLLNK